MSCDVGEVTKSLENELCYDYNYELFSFSKLSVTSPTSQLILILQTFRHFTYVTSHSATLPSLYLRHNSFSNPSVTSPTSQLILQPFFRLSYVTGFSLTLPGGPPMSRSDLDIFHSVVPTFQYPHRSQPPVLSANSLCWSAAHCAKMLSSYDRFIRKKKMKITGRQVRADDGG